MEERNNIIHKINFPWRIVIGEGAINEIPKLLESLNVNSVLVVVGEKTYQLVNGDISKTLKQNGYDINFFVAEKADSSTVNKTEEKAKELKSQILFGVGGGKNIDIAKSAAYDLGIPYISVPTIPSHDGIASASTSIFKNGAKHSMFLNPPVAIVADMKYLVKAPRRFYSAGAGDAIAKFTSVLDWKLARREKNEYYGEYAAQLAFLAARIMIRNSKRYEKHPNSAIRLLTEALISCGYAMCVAGSSRPCSGSEHLFSHAIDSLFPENEALHGEKCALGTLIMSYYHEKDYHSIRQALLNLGLPTNAEQIKIPPEILVKAVTHSYKMRDRYTILNKLGIKEGKEKKVENDLGILGII